MKIWDCVLSRLVAKQKWQKGYKISTMKCAVCVFELTSVCLAPWRKMLDGVSVWSEQVQSSGGCDLHLVDSLPPPPPPITQWLTFKRGLEEKWSYGKGRHTRQQSSWRRDGYSTIFSLLVRILSFVFYNDMSGTCTTREEEEEAATQV